MNDFPLVVIGIPTYLRARGLMRVLRGLEGLTIPENFRLEIMVVDNDPLVSGKDVVEEFTKSRSIKCSYFSESHRGISPVRNHILDTALQRGADFLAFIDDDEVPSKNWLINLLKVQREWRGDIVGGPVTRIFPPDYPAWHSHICFFEARREPTGPTRNNIDTGNALLHLPAIRQMGLRFDESLSLSGGEDMLFSCQARQHGARLIWASEAEVFEYVPEARLNRKWILKRAFRSGCVTAVIDRKLHPWWLTWCRNLGKALIYFLAGGIKLLVCFYGSPHKRYAPLIFWARGTGFLAGLVGFNFQEYRSTTSD